ncbi:DUF1758 domain-containing protein [Trichonephila clavipes]|nr:DUF1758 domain-containing protein [Trichonephila clavipes]
MCASFSHNSLICEDGQRATGGLLVTPAMGVQSPCEERGDSRDIATTSLVSLSAKEKKNNISSSVLLQTFSALVNAKPKGSVQLRCMLDGGANKSFILREVVELLDLKVVDKKALVIYTFGSEAGEKRTYDIVEGKEEEVNCKDIITNHLIVENEEFDFDRVRNLWSLERIGINPDNEVPLSDTDILKSFELNRCIQIKDMKIDCCGRKIVGNYIKSNYEIAKRRLLNLSKTFEKNEELYLKYDEILKEHLRDGSIERVNMNLDKNINTGYFLSHLAVVREQKDSTKIKKGGPNLDLSTHNVETFRYTRVTFGVQCSPILLAAVIRLHIEKCINKYKRACEMLNELYVDDLINSTSDATEALQLSEEMIHILGEAGMNLRRMATNSTTLYEA